MSQSTPLPLPLTQVVPSFSEDSDCVPLPQAELCQGKMIPTIQVSSPPDAPLPYREPDEMPIPQVITTFPSTAAFARLTTEVSSIIRERDTLSARLGELMNQIHEMAASSGKKEEELLTAILSRDTEIERLTSSVNDSQARLRFSEEQAERRVKDEQLRADQAEKELSRCAGKLQSALAQLASHRTAAYSAKMAAQASEQMVDDMRQAFSTAGVEESAALFSRISSEAEKRMKHLRLQFRKVTLWHKEVEQRVDRAEQQLVFFQSALQDSARLHNEQGAKIGSLAMENEQLRQQLASRSSTSEAEFGDKGVQCDSPRREPIVDQISMINTLLETMEQCGGTEVQCTQVRGELLRNLSELNQRLVSTEEELRDEKQRNQERQMQYTQLQSYCQSLKQRIDAVESDRNELAMQAAGLRTELDQIKAIAGTYIERRDSLQNISVQTQGDSSERVASPSLSVRFAEGTQYKDKQSNSPPEPRRQLAGSTRCLPDQYQQPIIEGEQYHPSQPPLFGVPSVSRDGTRKRRTLVFAPTTF